MTRWDNGWKIQRKAQWLLRSPLWQVRALIFAGLGSFMLVGWSDSRQAVAVRNESPATSFWQGEAAPAREVLQLTDGPVCLAAEMEDFPDTGALAGQAARSGEWTHLDDDLRDRLQSLGTGSVERVQLIWSGARTGSPEECVLQGRSADFFIGNGTRSRDGRIIDTRSIHAPEEPLRICLIGTGRPTAAQQLALGEILNFLEARTGSIAVAPPRAAGNTMLAKTKGTVR